MCKVLVTGGSGFIGTNLIEHLLAVHPEWSVVNVDISPPKMESHNGYWVSCEILDQAALRATLAEHRPQYVVHLAARTDAEGKSLEDYRVNSVGTDNVIRAIQGVPSVERVVFTSTQFVCGPGPLPNDGDQYRPFSVYGESKVMAEEAVKASNLDCIWTIIRPTNVWGPWHPRYPHEFWRVLKQGRYFHPGGAPVIRSYGYVGTVVAQIVHILELAAYKVDRRVLYVGDPPINLLDWVNAFSRELCGRSVTVVPRPVLHMLALVGDAVNAAGGRFPLFSSRFRSMTENYFTPMQWTFDVMGEMDSSFQCGIDETVRWLRAQNEFWR